MSLVKPYYYRLRNYIKFHIQIECDINKKHVYTFSRVQ